MSPPSPRRLLLTGATGRLGVYLGRELAGRGLDVTAWGGRTAVDLSDPDATAAAFRAADPDVVIHTAAVSSVEECDRDPARAHRVNVDATGRLAELAAGRARFVVTSTDLVFDGERGGYREVDDPAPRSTYGRTKLAAERLALAVPGGVVVRLSLLFGPAPAGRPSFFDHLVSSLRAGRPVSLFADEWRTPLAYPAAAAGLVDVALSDFAGLLHLGGAERLSRLDMGRRLAAVLGGDPGSIIPTTRAAAGLADRPRDTSLDSTLWGRLFPETQPTGWEEALAGTGVGPDFNGV